MQWAAGGFELLGALAVLEALEALEVFGWVAAALELCVVAWVAEEDGGTECEVDVGTAGDVVSDEVGSEDAAAPSGLAEAVDD